MNQWSIAPYLSGKGLSAKLIYQELGYALR
jgi:hypothetical protein